MTYKVTLIVQVLIIVGLGLVWIVIGQRFDKERRVARDQISVLSNTVTSNTSKLDELRAANHVLQTDLATTKADYSNQLAATIAKNDDAVAELLKAETEAKASDEATAAELARLDKQIADLESPHRDLDTQSRRLQTSITNIDGQIDDLKRKLATSTSDRETLLQEAGKMQAKKLALEKESDDLATVRTQLGTVRAEIAAARNYEWIRRGIYASFHQKGGERLTHPVVVQPQNSNAVWQVELRQDGTVTVTALNSNNTPLLR